MDKRRKKKAPADRAAQRSDRGGKAGVLKKALHKSRGKRREKPARARKTERKAAGKKRWPKFAAALCVLGFLLFALPLPAGIADISNLSAMVVFALLAVVFLCWDGFVRALRRLWKRSWGKILLLLSGIGAAAVLLLLLVTSILVMGKMKARPGPEAGTVIVLGCQVRGQTPSLLLSYRIRAAADYLNEHPETKVIVSGGQGSGENISEAECMRRALIARGVAEDRILLEDRSRTTLEPLPLIVPRVA